MGITGFAWFLLVWTLVAVGLSALLFFSGGGHPPPMILIPFVWIGWAVVAAAALAVRWVARLMR